VEIRGFDVVGRLRRKTAQRRFRKEFPFRDVVRLPKKIDRIFSQAIPIHIISEALLC